MKKKQLPALLIIILFGSSALAYALNFSSSGQQTQRYSRAFIQIAACNERKEIPEMTKNVNNRTYAFNSTGMVTFPAEEEVTLGELFDMMNTTFSRTELMGYENGNGCNTTYSNEVSVWVGEESERLRQVNKYRGLKVENGDIISVKYI